MDIEINTIDVTVAEESCDKQAVSHEIQWYLQQALEAVVRDIPITWTGSYEVDVLELPEIDWDTETDMQERLVKYIKEAIEEVVESA